MRLPGPSAALLCAMRFRHTVHACDDWATGDAGMPVEEEEEEEEADQEEEEEEHNTLVSVAFGGTYCHHCCTFVISQVAKMLCSEPTSKSAVWILNIKDERSSLHKLLRGA